MSGTLSQLNLELVEASQVRDGAGEFALVKDAKGKVFISDVVELEISATEIRRAARANRLDALGELVTPPVAAYIAKYNLYRDTNET